MEVIFETVVPLFALTFCGFLAGKLEILGPASFEGLNRYVFYFALPALSFSVLASIPISEVVNGRFVAAYLIAGLLCFALAGISGGIFFGLPRREAAMVGAGAALGNTGYMGLPLVGAALGDRATGIMALGIAIEAVVLIPLAMMLVESDKGSGNLTERLRSLGSSLARNPLIISLVAGVSFSAFGLSLPVPAANFVDLLASTAGPVALFALGATLSAFRVASNPAEVSYVSAFKLVGYPLLMLSSMWLLGVPGPWVAVALVSASLPVAANVFVISRQYDVWVQQVSSAVLISTAVSIFTVSLVVTMVMN